VKHIVVLISGRGSNMEAIVRACIDERWDARIAAVLSNRADAAGLAFARERGIAAEVVDHRAFATRDAFDSALGERIEKHGPDVVALAGFMRILGAAFVRRFDGRLVNVHPSLLPAFPGLETHRRALEAGCKASGASVHFVTAELDHGPIIAQAVVPVLADDDVGALAARVLVQEHRLYPRAISWLVDDRLERRGGIVRHRDGALQLLLPGDAGGR
jgi:phosphoribosylglycinamide formyltransferase 1